MKKLLLWSLLGLTFIITSCGSDDSSKLDVSGFWNGSWLGDEAYDGALVIEFEQEDNRLRGQVVISNNPCLDECQLWGNIDSNGHVDLLVVSHTMPTEEVEVLNPLASIEELKALNIDIVTVTGDFTDNQFSAEFYVVEWDFCTNSDGIFELTREGE